jgi:hypothetical protein
MTTPHHFPSDSNSLEGRVFRPATHADLVEAVEQAFDYRGDVSLELASGRTVEGCRHQSHQFYRKRYDLGEVVGSMGHKKRDATSR